MSAPNIPPVMKIRFSTDPFPERERPTAWRETFGRGVTKVDIDPLDGVPFHARMELVVMSNLAIARGEGTLGRTARTRGLLSDGNDGLTLQIMSCDGVASQFGREVTVAAGDGVFLSNSDVGSFTYAQPGAAFAVGLPRASLGPFLHDPSSTLLRPVPKENQALRLLRSYVESIHRDPPTNIELQALAATHVHDLVALALGATPDGAEIARSRGVRAARLHAARTYVMRNLGRQDLSAVQVAAHLGVTPRYVHMLFEAEDVSFSQFLLLERLARAHRMLTAPRHSGDTISVIAFTAGFVDLSHFNRSFRRRYGCTPSDVRAAAPGERKEP